MTQPVADVYVPKESRRVELSQGFTIKIHERATVDEIRVALANLPGHLRVRKVDAHKASPNDQRDWDTVTIFFWPERFDGQSS